MNENQFFQSSNQENNQQNYSTQPHSNVNYNTNYNTNYNSRKRGKGCLIAVIIALVIFLLMIISIISATVAGISSAFAPYSYYEEPIILSEKYVETIRIEGTIDSSSTYSTGYNHSFVLNRIDALIYDNLNKGLLLYINSGGGSSYDSDELYLAIKKYKDETNRPVYAYYGKLAASGAVLASMAADEIYANRSSMTGSIGTIMSTYNVNELFDNLGIKEVNIASGNNKSMLSPGEEIHDEQLAILQTIVDENYEIFVNIVSEEREIPLAEVKAFADGRLYSPTQALDLNLIDGIMSYDEFMEYAMDTPEFYGCLFIENEYVQMPLLRDFLFSMSGENNSLDLLNKLNELSKTPSLNFE